MRTFSQSALQYARQGFPIFPCHPSEKRPLTPEHVPDLVESGGSRPEL